MPQWNGPKCPANRTHCYDEVDLSLCFEDSAILYGIVGLFWLLAAILFLCGNGIRPRLPVSLLHTAKIVSHYIILFTIITLHGVNSYLYNQHGLYSQHMISLVCIHVANLVPHLHVYICVLDKLYSYLYSQYNTLCWLYCSLACIVSAHRLVLK